MIKASEIFSGEREYNAEPQVISIIFHTNILFSIEKIKQEYGETKTKDNGNRSRCTTLK